MKAFEDLIEELKEENLLEETVIDLRRTHDEPESDFHFNPGDAPGISEPTIVPAKEAAFVVDHGFSDAARPPTSHGLSSQGSGKESHRKRAMEEVSSLQMVEHVLSGIEREHMKMSPASFDDLSVKTSLHRFLQAAAEPGSADHSEAERELMQEIQSWVTALARRDANISVANLRRYCENSRPVLSSQALIALARYYRNAPFSEPVRGKFDFVMTKLFSRDLPDEKRKLLFGPVEMIGHIKTLYSNWSSLALYPAGENSAAVAGAVRKFKEFAAESDAAPSFDSLVAGDFFNRIRLFKEESNELFLAADVTAAAIDCNVRVGNRFIELVRSASELSEIETIEAKYGYTYDTVISNATSKTLNLLELVREDQSFAAGVAPDPVPVRTESKPKLDFERAPVEDSGGFRLFGVNKWLWAVLAVALLLSGGVFFWSENAVQSQGEIANATTIQLADPDLQKHIRLARSSNETLYGVAQPTWEAQSQDEQKELLKKALDFAQKMNMKRVNILNNKGRTIGYAAQDKIEVLGPQ